MKVKCSNIEYDELVECPVCGGSTDADCQLDPIEDMEVEIPDNTPVDKIEEVVREELEQIVGNNIGFFDHE